MVEVLDTDPNYIGLPLIRRGDCVGLWSSDFKKGGIRLRRSGRGAGNEKKRGVKRPEGGPFFARNPRDRRSYS